MSQVSKWGNSLAVRIPKSVAEEMGLQEGDDITMEYCRRGRELVVWKTIPPLSAQQKEEMFAGLES